jgi:hypothetical protein
VGALPDDTELFSGSYNDLTDVPTIPDSLSDLSDDSTHRLVTDAEKTAWNGKSDFSGSYNDLTDKPTIPDAQIQSDWNQSNTSAKDYIKNKPTIPDSLSDLSDDSTHRVVTDAEKSTWSAKSDFSGSYNDLTDKPTIPTVPTDVSAFNNDAGYLTASDISGKEDKLSIIGASGETLNAEIGKYYRFSQEVNTLAVTLPSPTDSTYISNIIFFIPTGTTPAITFSSTNTILYQNGFALEASKTYEINALWNGAAWVIAAVEIEIPT